MLKTLPKLHTKILQTVVKYCNYEWWWM